MFGFVVKRFKEWNALVYNGMRSVMKNVVDADEALLWYKLCQGFPRKEITIRKFWMEYLYNLPVVDAWGTNVTDDFKLFLRKSVKDKIIDDIVVSFRIELLKDYDIVDVSWATVLREKDDIVKEVQERDMGMMYMKMFLDGFYRFSKVDIEQKGTKAAIDVGFDYTWSEAVEYRYKGEKYKTNILWVYAPMVWNAMFWDRMDFWWWRVLQNRQLDAIFSMGHITYIAWARRLGKTYLLSLISAIATMSEWFSLQERWRPRRINFFWLTDESNETVVEYILEMSKKFMKDRLFKRNVKSKTLTFYSWENALGKVKFFSAESRGKGRGTFADWIILDEAAYMDYEVFRVNLPIVLNQGARLVCISTIDPKTKKNRFYQHLIEAEIAQLDYAPLEDQIMAIRNKYGFDKVKNRKDIKASMLINAKKELMNLRFKVGLRFTIDDCEYMTMMEKKRAIAEAKKQGLDYMYAELYSQFLDERTIFNSDWVIIEEERLREMNFESIVLAYDTASEYDNAALCAVGVKSGISYILESTILDSDPIKQIEYIKLQRENYTNRIINYRPWAIIPLVVDCSSTPQHILSNLELRGLWVNLPIRYTWGSIAKRDGRFMLVPKELFVNISTEFFKKDALRISSACTREKWLVEEMAFFQRKETDTARKDRYEAVQGKDDQVNAMMMALFYVYENDGMKYRFINDDVNNAERKSFEEFMEMEESKKKYEKSWLKEVMRKHWF